MPQQTMPGQGGQMGIDNIENMALNVMYNIASIITMPVEIFTHPEFGTTYFAAPIFFLSAVMMIVLSAFIGIAGAMTHMIPLARIPEPMGMFSFGSFTTLFFLASFYHGIRLWKLMIHPEREQCSSFEGPALPLFSLLPKGKSFWFVRIVYEPVALWALSILLSNMFVIQFPLMLYFQIAAFFLAMKQYIAWFKTWQYIRHLLDMAFMGPIIAKIVNNTATDDELATVHLASLPKDPDLRKATVAHFARAYEEERNPKAGKSQPRFMFLVAIIAGFILLNFGGGVMRRAFTHTVGLRPAPTLPTGKIEAKAEEVHRPDSNEIAFRQLSPLVGIWQGGGVLKEKGSCRIHVDLQPRPPASFIAYSSLSCISMTPFMHQKTFDDPTTAVFGRLSPTSTILTGEAKSGAIALHSDKNIGTAGDGCTMTDLTLTPFSDQLAAEWKENACPGGQLVMERAAK